jgi:hypothetical protein
MFCVSTENIKKQVEPDAKVIVHNLTAYLHIQILTFTILPGTH